MEKHIALVVDDHKIFCEGLALLVERTGVVQKAFMAFNGSSALDILKDHHIAIALIDARMPGFNGIDLIKAMHAEHPSVKIIGMTMFDEPSTIQEFLNARVNGVLLKKSTDHDEVKLALEQVLNNQPYVSAEISDRLKNLSFVGEILPKLTAREKEIVQLLSKGNSTKEISAILNISPFTVEDYRKKLLDKTKVRNVAELVSLAHLNGLI